MRPTKFRGQILFDDECTIIRWIDGDLVRIGDRAFIFPDDCEHDNYALVNANYQPAISGFCEVHPDTVEQYLRKDKNGEEIYSNMPIRYCDKDYPNGFVWDESGLRWTLNDGYFHTHYGKTGTGGEDDHLDLEVIHDEEKP